MRGGGGRVGKLWFADAEHDKELKFTPLLFPSVVPLLAQESVCVWQE